MIDEILKYLLDITVYGSGISVIVYLMLKWFGQKWFENQFAQKLEEFRRKQSEILEQYRYQISTRYNRVTKIHEKEFEILPEAWHKLQDTYIRFVELAAPLQQWPDLNNYTTAQFEEFLDKCELLDFQKKEIKQVPDKLEYYRDKSYWIRLTEARKSLIELRKYLRYNKLFFGKNLFKLFSKIEIVMIEAETELEHIDKSTHWKETYNVFKKLRTDTEELLTKIEDFVQGRLHFENTN